jgi:predicted nucleotide-binding protein
MTGMDFEEWVTSPLVTPVRPAADGMTSIDSALIHDLAGLLAAPERDLALTVRSLLDLHGVAVPVYEIRTGSWRIDVRQATARLVLSGAVAAVVMEHLGAAGYPAAILCAVAGLLFSIRRAEIGPGDLVLHAALLDAGMTASRDLGSLYAALPADIRAELTIAELADLIGRFYQAGLARWDDEGITLAEAPQGHRVRLVIREPGLGLVAGQARDAVEKEATEVTDVSRKVFVVYGRDEQVRRAAFDLLRALDLQPQEWEPLVAATGSTLPNLNEVVTAGLAAGQAQAVLAILTPDDMVTLHPALRAPADPADETTLVMQSRPNVLIEVGMALSAYRHRTIIVEIGRLRRIADLDGLNVIRFDGSEFAIGKIVERLKLAGCAVNDKGSDWRDIRRFADLDAYRRRPDTAS